MRFFDGFRRALIRRLLKTTGSTGSTILSAFMHGSRGQFFGSTNIPFIEAVNKGYRGLVWVYRCVKEIGEAVGAVGWKVGEIQKDGTFKELPNHPLAALLNQPNPLQDGLEFFEAWAIFLSLSGNDYWNLITVDSGRPFQLFHVRPDWMTPKPDPRMFISGYELDNGVGDKHTFKPEEIIHFKYMDPLDPYKGLSPLTAAQRTMETENAAILWNKTTFDNSAIPGGVLTVPAQVLQTETRKKLEEDLETQFTQDNMHKPLVLWGGMTWQQMALSQKDLEFMHLKLINKFEICAALGVPPGLVGANEDPTYSNIGIERMAFWEDTIMPMISWLKRRINLRLAPLYGPKIVVIPDYSHVPAMREIFSQKVKQAKELWMMGWPINMVNKKLDLGMDSVAWGDVWWTQMNMVPIAGPTAPVLALPDSNTPDPSADDPATEDSGKSRPKESKEARVIRFSGVRR